MKKTVFLGIIIFGAFAGIAQTENSKLNTDVIRVPTNCMRYKLDFEVKGWRGNVIQDSSLVNQLNLNFYESKRKDIDDVELFDSTTGLTVIVYSSAKTTANKTAKLQ